MTRLATYPLNSLSLHPKALQLKMIVVDGEVFIVLTWQRQHLAGATVARAARRGGAAAARSLGARFAAERLGSEVTEESKYRD